MLSSRDDPKLAKWNDQRSEILFSLPYVQSLRDEQPPPHDLYAPHTLSEDQVISSIENNSTVSTPTSATASQDPLQLQCEDCNKIFDTRSKYRKHRNTHTRPHKCPVADCQSMGFASRKDLERHWQSIHATASVARKFFCLVPGCSYSQHGSHEGFSRRDNFLRHLRRAHNIEDSQPSSQSTKEATLPPINPSLLAEVTQNKDRDGTLELRSFINARGGDHSSSYTSPSSTIPPVVSAPLSISTVPFERNRNFVGRQAIFEALESQFSRTNSHNRVALAGLGGTGKSQIAIEYSYRLREKDPQTWVFWVHAGSAVRFEQSYKSIAALLHLPGWNDPKTDIFDLVSKWLSKVDNCTWLMILDNADDVDVFRQVREENFQTYKTAQHAIALLGYIPQTTNGSVLITTRNMRAAAWLSGGYESIIRVEMMDEVEAMNLLRTRIPPSLSTELDLEQLVRELNYLPLAITQATAYINARANRMTVPKYLTLYRQSEANQRRLLDEDFGDLRRDPDVPNSVIKTWHISFDQIKQTNSKSAQLLSLMAMLDRQGIPESLLLAADQDPLDFEDALSTLHEFSLITIEKGGESFKMHRLVQLATRRWLEKQMEIQRWQEEATNVLSKAFPKGEHSNWRICETLWPHAQEVLKYELASDEHLLARASLLYNMAWYSFEQGHYTIASKQIQESLTIRKRILNDSDESILDSVELRALVLCDQGRYYEAEAMSRRALGQRKKVLGSHHPTTLSSMDNLAGFLNSQGKYNEAELLGRQTLSLKEAVLGEEHPNTLTSMANLALTFWNQGRWKQAEELEVQVLEIRMRVLGVEHPNTITSMANLASTYWNQGRWNEAEELEVQVIETSQKVLGADHPDTLASIANLASTYKNQERWMEAEELEVQVMETRKRVLGAEHPDTLTSMANLALTYLNQGRWKEAEELFVQVVETRKRVLGVEHPSTMTSMNNLAHIFHKQGRNKEAIQLMEHVLKTSTAVIGPNHPITLAASKSLNAWTHRTC